MFHEYGNMIIVLSLRYQVTQEVVSQYLIWPKMNIIHVIAIIIS